MKAYYGGDTIVKSNKFETRIKCWFRDSAVGIGRVTHPHFRRYPAAADLSVAKVWRRPLWDGYPKQLPYKVVRLRTTGGG